MTPTSNTIMKLPTFVKCMKVGSDGGFPTLVYGYKWSSPSSSMLSIYYFFIDFSKQTAFFGRFQIRVHLQLNAFRKMHRILTVQQRLLVFSVATKDDGLNFQRHQHRLKLILTSIFVTSLMQSMLADVFSFGVYIGNGLASSSPSFPGFCQCLPLVPP